MADIIDIDLMSLAFGLLVIELTKSAFSENQLEFDSS